MDINQKQTEVDEAEKVRLQKVIDDANLEKAKLAETTEAKPETEVEKKA